jgi:hypothetical protein
LLPVGFLAVCVFAAGITFGFLVIQSPEDAKQLIGQTVLGQGTENAGEEDTTHFERATIPSIVPTALIPSPTPQDYSVAFTNIPTDVTLPNSATFTWTVSGPSRIIKTTSVYLSSESSPGMLLKTTAPTDTKYTDMLTDFLDGTYTVPLVFVGNANFSLPGTYFYRAYALISGKHYWSDERTLNVKPEPKNEIRVIDRPTALFAGDTATFTWEITGPAGTTPFTAIVGAKESKPGGLGTDIGLEQSSYSVFVNDFTAGNFAVPLRYIGNYKVTEPGTYYFRALAFINGKNFWTDEYSFTVQ